MVASEPKTRRTKAPDPVSAARMRVPDDEMAEALAGLYHLFADATRIRILSALVDAELCVNDLAAALDMSQSAISHQLSLLKLARLVRTRREGRSMFYALDDDHVRDVLDLARAHVAEKE